MRSLICSKKRFSNWAWKIQKKQGEEDFISMPKKNKYKGRSAEKVGGGKHGVEERTNDYREVRWTNMYRSLMVSLLSNATARQQTSFFFSTHPGERGAQIFNGKTITASRSHVDVALAVAKKFGLGTRGLNPSSDAFRLENAFDSILKLGKQTQDENSRAILENPNIDKRIDFLPLTMTMFPLPHRIPPLEI